MDFPPKCKDHPEVTKVINPGWGGKWFLECPECEAERSQRMAERFNNVPNKPYAKVQP